MIELQGVTKLYGNVIGVNDVTVSLPPGAYGLLGPNGSGKSTLLNLLTGQLRPSSGTLNVLGGKPWGNTRVLKNLGLCPERDVLYADVSAIEWVTYLLELHGFRRAKAHELAEAALQEVGMAEAMSRPIRSYSLGMRQRTKLAQAIAHQPQLLILDEPFNGLDPIGRFEMTSLLKKWIADGRSLILASHVLHEVEAITRSFLLIRGGRLLASGSAEEVHGLLADLPNDIHIRCERPSELGGKLMEAGLIDGARVDEANQEVIVSTKHPGGVFDQLPAWTQENAIYEVEAADESLQNLFTQLMRIHRGEHVHRANSGKESNHE